MPLVWIVAGALYRTLPPSPDQWLFDYTGWMVLQGAIPYETFVDGNWPACHWLHALSTLLFGNTPYSWRTLDFMLMAGSTLVLSDLLQRLWGRAAGIWVLFLYPCLYVVSGQWFAGQRDIVGANLCFAALWCYWRGLTERRLGWQVGTGLVLAFCTLIKPTFALLGLALGLHALVSAWAGSWRVRDAILQVAVAGIASFVGLALGFFALTLQGTSMENFYEAAVQWVLLRYDSNTVDLAEALRRAAWANRDWVVVGAALSLALRLGCEGRRRLSANLLFPAMWLAAIVSYFMQAQALSYTLGFSYAATVPILCSGLALASASVSGGSGLRRIAATACVLIAIAGTAKRWSNQFAGPALWLSGRISAAEHQNRYQVGDGIPAGEAYRLASELAELVPAEGSILVWGRANVISFLAQRPQPTRFHHNVAITPPFIPDDLKERWYARFREDLERAKPEACLVNQRELGWEGDRPSEPVAFLRSFLERHYEPVRAVGESVLYLRRGSSEPNLNE